MTTTTILDVADLHGYYSRSHVLQNVALAVGEDELVTLLGRNSAGKSITLKTIAGVITPHGGQVRFRGKDIARQPPHRIAAQGLYLVPERRGILKLLTVEENLRLGTQRDSSWQLVDIYHIFPRLHGRRRNGGANLSGGEQQMLAIGRALMSHPRLLMFDEPVEGLAPVIVEEVVAQLKVTKQAGVSILLVEQNLEVCTQLADRHVIIEQGRMVYTGTNEAFRADDAIRDRYLGVGLAAQTYTP